MKPPLVTRSVSSFLCPGGIIIKIWMNFIRKDSLLCLPCEVSTLFQLPFESTDSIFAKCVSCGNHSSRLVLGYTQTKLTQNTLALSDFYTLWTGKSPASPQVHSSLIMVSTFLHQRLNVPAHPQNQSFHLKVRLNDQSAEVSNRCYNKTNQRDLRSRPHCSGDFDHSPTSSPSPLHCSEDTLLLFTCTALCADLLVLSQLLSEWGLTHPAFGLLFCSLPGLGLWSFLLAALGAAAGSKTSLLSCCGPSVQEGHHLGSAAMWHDQRCCVKGPCTELPRGGLDSKMFSYSSLPLVGWKPWAHI